ncbi:MAG: CDP-alcohol phosphatidyltransferase family protein, partial [Nanoarchaeota archaeon]|nr:CDP-alcohol phosphatidyltransferase family protein [Nanoarchaeota archaeon]
MPTITEIREKAGYKEYTSFHHRLIHEIGFYFTKVFFYLPFTPNQITVMWMLFQLASIAVPLKGTYWSILLGVFLFQFGYILDTIDGQIARLRNQRSLSGIYLDGLAHNLNNPIFFISLSIGV